MAEAADRIEEPAMPATPGETGEPEVRVDSLSVLMVVGGIPAMSAFFVVLFLLTTVFDLPF